MQGASRRQSPTPWTWIRLERWSWGGLIGSAALLLLSPILAPIKAVLWIGCVAGVLAASFFGYTWFSASRGRSVQNSPSKEKRLARRGRTSALAGSLILLVCVVTGVLFLP